jgi:peptide/nickel transport system ATP-binding protein
VFTDARHPYAEALAWAFPIIGDAKTRMSPRGLPGDPPDPADVPSGCSFHPRCAVAEEQCSVREMQLWPAGDGRQAACVRVLDSAAAEAASEQSSEAVT